MSKRVLLLHENTPPYMAAHTVETIEILGLEVSKRLLYSPGISPFDYYLVVQLKIVLQGRRIATNEEVQETVHKWLRNQKNVFRGT